MINIPETVGVISGLNECANLFQWVRSAISSLQRQWNGTQNQDLQEDDVLQLQRELQCLSDTLPAKYHLIDRAEWRIHDNYVANVLSKLKDAVFDAEDLLDEFRWYQLKVAAEGNAAELRPFTDFFRSVTQGSFNKVTDIKERLNNFSSQLEKMGLHQATPRFDKSVRPETSSFPTEAKIFGRDEEMKELIRLLGVPANNSREPSRHKRRRSRVGSSASSQVCTTLDNNEATTTSVPVLPIVGIGGVGKTTLAQNICNHPQVKSHFDLIIWTCVSDDFDVKRLTKEAIEQSSCKAPTTDNLNSLQHALVESVNERRFLIVLDDMWDENGQFWKTFCAPFKNVVQGSMMLVTTRSQKVADIVRTTSPFPLEGLKDDVFWKFFQQCVVGSGNSGIDTELQRIGKEILPKLKGSPLAAKTLGRLLGMSLDPAHWDMILKSQLWEIRQKETDILPALRLSYMYLPFHLKRCFSFCSVYPKDHNFEKANLAEIWVAEGFVEPQGNIPLQDIGDQYFEELAHLSFFQKFRGKYVIHDLMHDMAQLVSKDECFIIKDKRDFQKVPENVRHLSVLKCRDVECSELLSLCKHRKLRTLLCHMSLRNKTGNSVMEKWCTELLCMRVIFCASISKWGLPESISSMKHVRYLKISERCLFKSLPAALCCLYNLQILYAKKCEFDNIPSGFGMLINLQKFESLGCQFHQEKAVFVREGATKKQFTFRRYPGESLPSGFHPQNLPNISSLVYVAIEYCNSLESVPTENFPFLEELKVQFCPKISSRRLFAPSLKKLELKHSGNLGDNIECSSLTVLHLSWSHLTSIELQNWSLPLLQKLCISNCSLTFIRESEPISTDLSLGGARSSIGKFPLLTHLTIGFCGKLETLDDLLLYLPAIESVQIIRCDLLSSLPTERFGIFLKDLRISSCPRLNWHSGMVLPSSLLKLFLWDCGDFSAWYPSCLENLTSLETLILGACKGIVSVPGDLWSSNLKSLQNLKITGCPDLVSIGGPKAIANIKRVEIADCPKLKELESSP